jgi:hypothetical protein
MEEKQKEILKRKKIRKLLLLRINDELKHINKFKSNILINSKTIQELNALYNNDILLFEKSTIYSNYIKTEETVISNNNSSINISKTISQPLFKPRTRNKNKIKEESNRLSIIEMTSMEEESTSPIIDFPKKIELGGKKFLKGKSRFRNNGSIIQNIPKKISSEKEIMNENILNKSTKLGNGDLHLHKLIEKITSIKNNESTEGVIRQNIKKLRNYCYQLRKKRKKIRKPSINKNNSSRKKSKDRGEKKIERSIFKKRSSILNKDVIEKSLFLIKQNDKNKTKHRKSNPRNDTSPSPSPSPHFNFNVKKKSTAEVVKFNLNNNKYKINIIPPAKNIKYHSSIKNKEKIKKFQTLNEIPENNKQNKLAVKKKFKKSFLTEEKMNTEENTPYINQIKKEIMRSTMNEIKMKIDANEDGEKKKFKNNKLKLINNKRLLNKNISINISHYPENEFKYFNTLNKKDKIALHEGLIKSSKKIRKIEPNKKENTRKSQENDEEIIKLKKLSIVLDSRKKLKKKIIDSPDRKVYRMSNFSNYVSTNTSKEIGKYKRNKSFLKNQKKMKD